METRMGCSSSDENKKVQPDLALPSYVEDDEEGYCQDCLPAIGDREKEAGSVSKPPKRKHRKKRTLTGVSRQRRAANDRERKRNIRINQSFVHLKNTLPLPHVDISKIEILRLAMIWIDHLGTLLKDYDQQKDLLNIRQMETSRSNEYTGGTGDYAPVKHDCLYHQFPDLKNTLWEDSIGLPERMDDDNDGCIHIRSNSRFHVLFS